MRGIACHHFNSPESHHGLQASAHAWKRPQAPHCNPPTPASTNAVRVDCERRHVKAKRTAAVKKHDVNSTTLDVQLQIIKNCACPSNDIIMP